MFDTMTMTKIVGGVCGTLLIFLLGNWAAESLYHVGGEAHDGSAEAAYVIAVDEGADHDEAAVEVSFEEVFAAADAEKGERVFSKCKACHKLEDGANGTGPHLYGTVGRDIGSVAGFGYSAILTELAGDWTPEQLNGFLENPRGYANGTKMSFKGLPSIEDRANLIAYLSTIGG
ncbi:MAG: cytochrome c family protein [Paracoccaceae bacterium]|nr:cytochrome c family protein [Paracoccaceae bacterium]